MLLIVRWLRNPVVSVAVLLIAGIAVYAGTLQNPFVFDDNLNIVDNAKVKDLSRFWPPSGNRWLGDLSFGLNYAAGGLDVSGYHLVNLVIHLCNTLLVYALMRLAFRTPIFGSWSRDPENSTTVPAVSFLAGTLFCVHPIQTQAVTYIIQRFTSLATLFYLLAVVLYLAARITMEQKKRTWAIVYYAGGLLSAVLAMKTKEIAFTLPFAVCLAEVTFFRSAGATGAGRWRARIGMLVPFLLTLVIIPAGLLSFDKPLGETVLSIPKALNVSAEISRHDYFLSQIRVVSTYLRLLFFPVNQSFDYLYPVVRSLADAGLLLAAALHLSLLSGAAYLIVRPSASSPLLRLAGFGVIWFYLALSVESSVIPISDVIFEHRLYLPGVGLLLSCTAGFGYIFSGAFLPPKALRGLSLALICLVTVFGIAAFERNTVWQEELSLWQDVVAKNPSHSRGHSMIGVIYKQRGEIDWAIESFRNAIQVKPDYAEAHVNLGSSYIIKGMLDEGLAEMLTALGFHSLDKIDTAALYINIAYYHIRKGTPEKAFNYLRLARDLTPEDATVHFFFAMAYDASGDLLRAGEHRSEAHRLNPEKY